jgi:hypothetical protein
MQIYLDTITFAALHTLNTLKFSAWGVWFVPAIDSPIKKLTNYRYSMLRGKKKHASNP